jgi:uncharacterized protein YndB with AHSA1/START domain
MIKIEQSGVINRPIEEVFEYVTNPENIPIWMSHVLEVKKTSEGPVDVGTTMAQLFRFLGRKFQISRTATEYQPNRKYGAKDISGPGQVNFMATFESVSGGTKITYIGEIEPAGLLNIAEPILARMLRRQAENNFATLKDLMEANALL